MFAKACRLDVVAFKPGNVSLWSAGHGMSADDFLRSAAAAAPLLADPACTVGERIETAVTATQNAVHCNTNLGIILLLAPLASAALKAGPNDLRARLSSVLSALDIDDAERCLRAIQLARPAGLGTVAEQDVARPPSLNLRAVMHLAEHRDRIARQYVNDYDDIFRIGVPALAHFRTRWRSLAWACSACYLSFLGAFNDSHVVRKHGSAIADRVRERAQEVAKALKACENPRRLTGVLTKFDDELKADGINPGTSADLTVASVSQLLVQERLRAK